MILRRYALLFCSALLFLASADKALQADNAVILGGMVCACMLSAATFVIEIKDWWNQI